jgi:UDP:flavonoid glycosyltransferase YjiC (YdhE family)
MAKIILATFGSLGDMHPKLALGLELKRRGHDVIIAAMEFYREKVEMTGLGFAPMRPNLDPEDHELAKSLMDTSKGPERVIKGIIMANIRDMYDDLLIAVDGADAVITGEIVYPIRSIVEKTGIKWVSTSLAPGTFFSAYDPFLPPQAPWFERLRFLGPGFHRAVFSFAKGTVKNWYEPYREFRRSLDLSEDHDPIFRDKFSKDLHLAMFSRALGAPQPDWPKNSIQTGFCFYDGQNDTGVMPAGLEEFLDAGEPPIVFTLGSAAVMDPRDFYTESIKAAKLMGRRAIMLYGIFNARPEGFDEDIAGFDYAPYSLLFPRAACVVHQGGVGTTAQVLRAGVPMLVMPYSHDQPDNAARCRRLGVARIIGRNSYRAAAASAEIEELISNPVYRDNALKAKEIVASEEGSVTACDAIEAMLE